MQTKAFAIILVLVFTRNKSRIFAPTDSRKLFLRAVSLTKSNWEEKNRYLRSLDSAIFLLSSLETNRFNLSRFIIVKAFVFFWEKLERKMLEMLVKTMVGQQVRRGMQVDKNIILLRPATQEIFESRVHIQCSYLLFFSFDLHTDWNLRTIVKGCLSFFVLESSGGV